MNHLCTGSNTDGNNSGENSDNNAGNDTSDNNQNTDNGNGGNNNGNSDSANDADRIPDNQASQILTYEGNGVNAKLLLTSKNASRRLRNAKSRINTQCH